MNKLLKDQAKSSKPDLIADRIVPLFGNNGWVWLQALYEIWAWPMAEKGSFKYPFQQGMSSADKASLTRRLKKYWVTTGSLFLIKTRPNQSEDEKNRLLEQCQHVSRQLENAYKQKDSSTINEIVEPFAKAGQWFCQDFFMYILSNPLSFFDFTQIAPDADDSERPFGKHFTLLEFLNAVEKVGQYMHYNSKEGQKEYEFFLPWLQKHAETLVNASASLEWEMRDNYSPMGDSLFSNWLLITISQLESAIKQEQNTTSIRDYLAAWMDPDFPIPHLDDFAKLTITRESLEILDDFACEHFNKSVQQMAYWDALRRPALYLLATLYKRGFFNQLAQNLQINAPIDTLLLSDLPPEKLDSWEDFRQALQECAFGRTKALQYFKDYAIPDKQAALIKRTDKRLLEISGDKQKWERNFEKIALERGLHSRVEVEFLLKQNEKRLEAVLASDEKPRIYAFISPPDPASGLKTQKASLMQLEYSTRPRVIALDTLEGFDRKYLELKHRLEDAHYGLSLPKPSCESLRSLVDPILALYILTCYPEFPEHLPSKENSAHKLKHYDPEYNLQCIEKRLDLHVVPGLLSHQQRFKRILRTLKAPDETYSETEGEQWSYIYDELDRQYPLKDSPSQDCNFQETGNINNRLAFFDSGTGLPYEAERQNLPPQLFNLFEYLFETRTVDEIKVKLWEEQADTHGDKEAQDKVSLIKRELKNLNSNWQVSRWKNPTRYKVERKPIEN